MESKLLNFLGLTRKSGNLILGANLVETAVKGSRINLIIVAVDASQNTKKKMFDLAGSKGIRIIEKLNKEDLGYALGKSEISVAGVTDARMAEVISDLSGESLLK